MCGEQVSLCTRYPHRLGSPPRVRGTEFGAKYALNPLRITPACAGNSVLADMEKHVAMDHPRVCGEQWSSAAALRCLLGSPPRVRGTVGESKEKLAQNRITPACAGNRLRYRCMSGMVGDHPRVCGEQRSPAHAPGQPPGSPPRVRGTGAKEVTMTDLKRITPACAGNSRALRVWMEV